ncbi:glucoamylase family protein [Bythopirellula goksoeyrii]|uniref:glucoamylase family protein n=1 Tax=Bythopirellula goksoeyrii TaxID=1400387 RepID=UPI001AEFA86C|nr:glucoamylase family protein [Bythopirellula goksoeyrii]
MAQTSFHDQHVIFENSAADESYYHSNGTVVAPSKLELSSGKIPVTNEHFVSPPNALRLCWKSVTGADWRLTLQLPERYAVDNQLVGDTLSMWCYAEEELLEAVAPRIWIADSSGAGLPSISLLTGRDSLQSKQWIRLNIPLKAFEGSYGNTRPVSFDARKLAKIVFVQGLDDGAKHVLTIDDVRITDSTQRDQNAPATPRGLIAEGQDSHVDLSWQPNEESDLLSYRVYRAIEGDEWQPIATRSANFTRHADFIGPDKRASYKISSVDGENNESPLSEVASSMTHLLDDQGLLDMVQRGCFRYYWDAANRESGMALEVIPGDENLIALGGSGFGISALVVATEREFITREESVERMLQILRFLKKADRFHGVWPHFLDGRTGKVWPLFGPYDNGGDLVETAFIMQGLLTARQFFNGDTEKEDEIRETITQLWHEVEWDWFRKTPDGEVLYWHWSPDHEWHISHPLVGWNETMIVYLLAIASPTHPVPPELYYSGWAGQSDLAVKYRHGWSRTTEGDHYSNGNSYYGHMLDVGCGTGGDLFFTQFSYLGFDPRGIRDRYTNYFHNNRQLALINRAYCIDNPRDRKGYGPNCWGLSAGLHSGGGKPQPRDDNGTICCSAALGCFPYTPDESLAVLKHFYRELGGKIWGIYGFHDGFNATEEWFDECYMGLNQAQIVVGIENHRTGLLWKLFMRNQEVQTMLDLIGFVPDESKAQDP